MTNKTMKPAAKASELPLVKARLAEVEVRIGETREVCRASQGRDDRWIAAEKVLRQLEAERINLMEREMQIQAGLSETAVKAPVKRKKAREWPHKGLTRPEYPHGARQAGDTERIERAFDQWMEYGADAAMLSGKELGKKWGIGPDDPATAELVLVIKGQLNALGSWLGHRVKEIEDRLDRLSPLERRKDD